MGFITDTLRGVIREGKDAISGRVSGDGSRQRTSGDGSRQRTSGDGSRGYGSGYGGSPDGPPQQGYQQGYGYPAQGYPNTGYPAQGYGYPPQQHHGGPGLPPPHPTASGELPHHASAVDVAQAYGLVDSAVTDLKEAIAGLEKQSGILAAAKTVPADGWKEAGKTIAHDGRFPAKQLCQSAITKYEQAAQLVDGFPEIETTPEIQEGRLTTMARAVGGTAGTGALAVAFAGAQITTAVLVGFTPVGLIKKAVKKKRSKQAAANVEDMLHIMEGVRQQLEQLHRSGGGGFIQYYHMPQSHGHGHSGSPSRH